MDRYSADCDVLISFSTFAAESYPFLHDQCVLACTDAHRKTILSTPPDMMIYMWLPGGCSPAWDGTPSKFTKTLDTIYTDPALIGRVRDVIANFVDSRERHAVAGVPHKLSFLFEGRPGTGKTSLAKAIANHLQANVFVFNTEHIERVDTMICKMKQLLLPSECGRNAIFGSVCDTRTPVITSGIEAVIVLEDIHKLKPEIHGQILSVLDGIYDVTDCVIVMTSNVPRSKLDGTLMRDGRVNCVVRLGFMTRESEGRMFDALVPQFADVRTEFLDAIASARIVPATLESYFLRNGAFPTHSSLMANVKALLVACSERERDSAFAETDTDTDVFCL